MEIKHLSIEYKDQIVKMMQTFYNSPAVHTNGSKEIFNTDVENCINDSPYLEGYIFINDNVLLGYAMVAKSFSTEFGKPCLWIEDLYIKNEYRGQGIGGEFIEYISKKYPQAVIRLEVEEENQHAVHVYKKNGFKKIPYLEMIKF